MPKKQIKKISVILQQSVAQLGQIGEIKKVNRGYAFNFLLPRQLAIIATEKELNKIKQSKEKKQEKKVTKNKSGRQLIEKISKVNLIFKRAISASGKLYAAITQEKISKELGSQGIKVSVDQIIIKQPIKEIGKHVVSIKLSSTDSTDLKIQVKMDKEKEKKVEKKGKDKDKKIEKKEKEKGNKIAKNKQATK